MKGEDVTPVDGQTDGQVKVEQYSAKAESAIYSVRKSKSITNTNIFGFKISPEYEYEYYSVSFFIQHLQRYGASNVGGVLKNEID